MHLARALLFKAVHSSARTRPRTRAYARARSHRCASAKPHAARAVCSQAALCNKLFPQMDACFKAAVRAPPHSAGGARARSRTGGGGACAVEARASASARSLSVRTLAQRTAAVPPPHRLLHSVSCDGLNSPLEQRAGASGVSRSGAALLKLPPHSAPGLTLPHTTPPPDSPSPFSLCTKATNSLCPSCRACDGAFNVLLAAADDAGSGGAECRGAADGRGAREGGGELVAVAV
eukprot:2440523-Pleurochrysis_carterae.AAC.4